MNAAPQVLVVARQTEASEVGRIRRCLAAQTYTNTSLVVVPRDKKNATTEVDASETTVCPANDLARYLATSGAERVLFWPDEGGLKEAAIEKMVLALQVAPEQNGVADAARGSTGLWLARVGESTASLISMWMGPQIKWIEECIRLKPAFFHFTENLSDASNPDELRHPYAIEQFFGKPRFQFGNYQPIGTEPLWKVPVDEVDARSVLLLVSCQPKSDASRFILDLTGQLKAEGHRVTVVTTAYDVGDPEPWLNEFLQVVPDVFALAPSRPIDLPRLIVHLARTRRCGRVVISHSLLGYQLLPWLRTELPGVSFLDYTHIENETAGLAGSYAQRSANNQSLLDMSVVSSEHLRKWMIDHGADGNGLGVCHTNIDTDKWTPVAETRESERAELRVDSGTALILYPCHLVEQKRPELMCNIVAVLRKSTKAPFVVVVSGDGPLLPALRKFVADQGLQNYFRLLGGASRERLVRLHQASDILLLPSIFEGISPALFEAMALESVPVVADVGGYREVVTPDCGYLIPVRDMNWEFADYVTVLRCLLENPALRSEKGTACRERIRGHFQSAHMTKAFAAALDEAGKRHACRTVRLPSAAVCREFATLAVEQIRLNHESFVMREMGCLLDEKVNRQEKIIVKLQKQLQADRDVHPTPEEHEACS